MELSNRQEHILNIVKEKGPISGEQIATSLNLSRATLRPDLSILTMAGFLEAKPKVGYFYTRKKQSDLLEESLNRFLVRDYQSQPIVVRENESVYDAIGKMFLEDIGTLFVEDEKGHLAGVLSRKDLLRASIGSQDLNTIPVHIIMTRMPNLTVCTPESSILSAAQMMMEKQVDGLAVVEKRENGLKVIGRITKTNVIKAFVGIVKEE
ncbi:helix-turn-helix transcriptional regulator [Radiobacillus kanasensis]|uniref:helix-turn-helix transcriptional regulator n=1 Tax=Radiobacillus kanasensis TaxID=2844358 RepID=UPI001E507CA0|nr:helix-turn-helix transcriptional regulator [Radiobacillus kanasensis]UFT97806.1 helix-turn-helix transcriptional regulator [Radiobacillus kanasensis]